MQGTPRRDPFIHQRPVEPAAAEIADNLRRIEEQCSHAKEKLAQIRGVEADDVRPTIAASPLAVFDRAAHSGSDRPAEESTKRTPGVFRASTSILWRWRLMNVPCPARWPSTNRNDMKTLTLRILSAGFLAGFDLLITHYTTICYRDTWPAVGRILDRNTGRIRR